MIFVSFSIEKNIIPCSYQAPFAPPNLLHTTKSNVYLPNSLAAVVRELVICKFLTFHVPKFLSLSIA